MTANERRVLDRFIKHVNKKVAQIERNIKLLIGLKEFERRQAQVARATARKRKDR